MLLYGILQRGVSLGPHKFSVWQEHGIEPAETDFTFPSELARMFLSEIAFEPLLIWF